VLPFSDSEFSVSQVAAFSEAFGTDGRPLTKEAQAALRVTGTESVRNGFRFWQV
jgi:hypothetical protein